MDMNKLKEYKNRILRIYQSIKRSKNPQQIKKLQKIALIVVVNTTIIGYVIIDNLITSKKEPEIVHTDEPQDTNYEVPEVVNPQSLVNEKLRSQQEELKNKSQSEYNQLQSKLSDVQQALMSERSSNEHNEAKIGKLTSELQELRSSLQQLSKTLEDGPARNKFGINKFNTEEVVSKSLGRYLPAGTIIRAKLLNGLIAKTGVEAQNNPTPMVADVIDVARLPNGRTTDIKGCVLMLGAFGDLSMEGVLSRGERLVCYLGKSNEPIEVSISGVVFNRGLNAIVGDVKLVEQRNLINAWASSLLSGFLNSARLKTNEKEEYDLFGLSLSQNKPQSVKNQLMDSALAGSSKGVETVTDYYVKKAENIQPVIKIGSSQEIEVVLTAGVSLDSNSKQALKNKIKQER